MAQSVQSFFQQFAPEHEPDGGQAAGAQSPQTAAPPVPRVDKAQLTAERRKQEKAAKTKLKREEAKARKKLRQQEQREQEASRRKAKKAAETSIKHQASALSSLESAFKSDNPASMMEALAEATGFPDIAEKRAAVQQKFDKIMSEALGELLPVVEVQDLQAAHNATLKYAHYPGEVAEVCKQLRAKIVQAKAELKNAVAAEDFSALSLAIETYNNGGRIVQKEMKDARLKRSALLTNCARELASMAHENAQNNSKQNKQQSKKEKLSTAKQIASKLKKYADYPAEGSIGESIATLREMLNTRQAEEAEKRRLADLQRAKEEAIRAKEEAKQMQEEEEARFWAEQDAKQKAEELELSLQWEVGRRTFLSHKGAIVVILSCVCT